jgi:nucleoside-diphosphate-sugar epimerase
LGIPEGGQPADESAPRLPVSKKGALRNRLEERLERATEEGAGLLIVRAGDFFGRGAESSWLGHLTSGIEQGKVRRPTRKDALHEWAYLPDVAEITLRLLEHPERLSRCETFHFSGHRVTMTELVEALERAAGHELKVQPFPWFALQLARPFWKMAGEVLEMRYLWDEPVLLDDSKLLRHLGQVHRTPLVDALGETLRLGLCGELSERSTAA